MTAVTSDAVILDRRIRQERQYWVGRLAHGVGDSSIRLDHSRPAERSGETDVVDLYIKGGPYRRLIKLTNDGPFLLYTTLMAGLKLCLHKYTGSGSITVGSPARRVSNDSAQPANVLAIVDEVREQISFQCFLMNVRQTLLNAYANQRYPFQRVVKDLGLDGRTNQCPLFDIVLALNEIHVDLPEINNDITIRFHKGIDRLVGQVAYDQDLFRRETIEWFVSHYLYLLQAALDNTESLIGDLPVLSQAERHQVLVEWNDTEGDYSSGSTINRLFEDTAAGMLDAVSIVFGDEQITYGELDRRANQVAHRLKKLGVGEESLAGLCVQRSIDMVVGLLGILKCGAAYVPLDPSYPADRLQFMAADAEIAVLVTQNHLIDRIPLSEIAKVSLDSEWPIIASESEQPPPNETNGAHLAYMTYTSGSSGQPKGVEVLHRGVVRLVKNVDYVSLGADERILQAAPVAFDASTFEIYAALLNGGCLVLHDGDVPTGEGLKRVIGEQGVSTMWLTASLFNAVIDEDAEALKGLKQVLIGGEALSVEHVRRGGEVLEKVKLINGYGPTEATTFTCIEEVRDLEGNARSIAIGRPIRNTEVYVLDEWKRVVPVGGVGELHIAGEGLGRGYHRRAELTAERFIPNPFDTHSGSRLYKTGDLVRHLWDGKIEYLGRTDNQVKVRGFRIEPEEIEAALVEYDGIERAVVVVRQTTIEKQLVAYVVGEAERELTAGELRQHLRKKLPEQMVPSAFVRLQSLPLTANGKVDRAALPEPQEAVEEGIDYGAPRSSVEEVLAGIWAEVLKVKRVGIHHNFFELGGHSLLATQVISRVRNTFQVRIPLRRLFESPTVAGLAAIIEGLRSDRERVQAPPLRKGLREEELPLSFAQQRLWFIGQLRPDSSIYTVPAALRLSGRLSLAALVQSFDEIVRRHEILRTTIIAVNGHAVQRIDRPSKVTVPIVELQECGHHALIARLTRQERNRPALLSQGPLLRLTLLRLLPEEHVLLVSLHHIVTDGWSTGVFVRELGLLYRAFSNGNPSPLTDLEIQYADYACWQRRWLTGETLDVQLDYWKRQLADTSVLELPTDHPRGAKRTFRCARQAFALSPRVSEELRGLSQREQVTLFMTLLAAFQTLLYRYTGQEDICVASPIANRNRPEVERLIGCFVNMLVLRTRFGGSPDFRQLLRRVRETAMGAYDHQDVPFELVVDAVQPGRSLGHAPLAQVTFTFQNAPMEPLVLPDLMLRQEETGDGLWEYDLSLIMMGEADCTGGLLIYSTDLFDHHTIQRLITNFQNLLESIVADPDELVSDLSFLSGAELQLLEQWSAA